ncbi:ChaN family lipoprotein [Geomesophilobacter sediminis]|nr:ChaN family lipoprotein [Geomesophilobacter sediminis]
MSDAEHAGVIVVGETHDKKLHHQLQLEVIRDLKEKKKPIAIGLEMFQTASQKQLDEWVAGKMTEEEFLRVYARNWSVDWQLYRDIFRFARDNRIPMIALNIPMELVSKVAHQGFSSLSATDKKDLPPEVSCDLNTSYTEFLKRTYTDIASHAMSERFFIYFCEAQSLRNNGMAYNVSRYLQSHPDTSVVVLTGILHAVKTGIPQRLSQYRDVTCRVILPELPEFESQDALLKEADYVVQ